VNFRKHDRITEMAQGGRGCKFIQEIPIQKESAKMPEYRIKVAPNTVAYADGENNKLVVEFAIPGAPTDTIDVKILEDSIHLTAPARDIEYVSALALSWPVKPDKAEANYENGLLRIEVPFKDPMEDAVKVAITAGGVGIKTKALLQKTPEKGPVKKLPQQ
jgi:HSP20 family protein